MRSLSELLLDGLALSYPDAKVCRDGTEAIMKFLCKGKAAMPLFPLSPFTTPQSVSVHLLLLLCYSDVKISLQEVG